MPPLLDPSLFELADDPVEQADFFDWTEPLLRVDAEGYLLKFIVKVLTISGFGHKSCL